MASIHWTLDGNGDFSNLADWNNGKGPVPGTKDDAILDAAGATAYTVTASTSETVRSIQTAATATLAISAGTFTASAGTGTGSNAGTILVGDGTFFDVGGSISNAGLIGINALNSATEFVLTSNATLSGGGHVTLSDSANNYIFGNTTAFNFVNVDNTISGAGNIGNGQLTLQNQAAGVINAIGANALTINTGSQAVTNAGLIEASGAGGLTITSAMVKNSGGTLEANNGSILTLQGVDVIGGSLKTQGTGSIQATANGMLDGKTSAVSLSGSLTVVNTNVLTVAGSVANSGTLTINGGASTTQVQLSANTTLSGGGQVVMTDSANNYFWGQAAADTLVNVDNTISGAGNIGNGQLILTNSAAGVINAVGANSLVINLGGQALVNQGLLEATGAGGLTISGAAVDNTTGSITANAKSAVTFINATVKNAGGGGIVIANGATGTLGGGADIVGGTLQVQGTGSINVTGGTSELDGSASAITTNGPISIAEGSILELAGSIANSGSISVNGNVSATQIQLAANTTLSGGGQVVMSDSGNNYFWAQAAADTLVNVDNTISGAGNFGNGQLTLINQAGGVINAVGVNALVINPGGPSVTNAGLMEASGAGGLTLYGSTVQNIGGILRANNGSIVTLQSADIIGGSLQTQGTGVIQTLGNATLDGTTSTVSLSGPLNVVDSNALYLAGSVANSGAISVKGNVSTTQIQITANVTLSGGGQIVMSDSGNNYLWAQATTDTLANVDNTISGGGNFGNGQLNLVNQKAGTINASGSNALVINTGANTITNAGLMETTGAGGMSINSPISNTGTLLAHTGTLTVSGALTNVSGTTLSGGTYEADAGATLELPQNTSIATDKATIILNGSGSVIEAFSTATSTEVAIDSTLTTVASSGALEILGGRNWNTKLAMSNAGQLQLGGGKFSAKSLTNTGTTSGFGTITAPLTNNGVLSVQANKTLSLQGGGLTNLTGGTLTGGTYVVGAGATLQVQDNSPVTTLAATVDLAGAGATLQSLDTGTATQVTLESSLTSITATGVLQVLGARGYTSANAIGNAGAIQLGGGTFTSGTLTNAAGSSLTGFGTVASTLSESGIVTSSGGALAFTGTSDTFSTALGGTEIDFAGGSDLLQSGSSLTATTVGISGGATITLATGQSYGGVLKFTAGTIALGGNSLTLSGAGSALAGAVTGGGSLILSGGADTFNAGASLDASTTLSLTNAAAMTVAGATTIAGPFTSAAGTSLTISKGAVLTLSGATTFGASLSGAGTLALTGTAAMTLSGALADSGILSTATGTTLALGANTLTLSGTGSTLAGAVTGAGGTLALTGGTTAINTGASLGMSTWSISGGTASLNESLTFAGTFAESAGATLTLASTDTLKLTGAASLSGVINGAGTVAVSNATASGLTIGGTDAMSVTGSLTQTGKVTIGDATTASASLSVAKGATWTINGAVGISHGSSTASSLKILGTLIKSGATGTSVINLATADNGLIEAGVGTLDFSNKLTGSGALKIDTGATLEVDSTAASTLTVTFNGSGATLALKKPTKFASTISGYAVGDTIDLLKIAATGASINASDQLVIVNGSKSVATLQLTGNYSGATFTIGSDGNGGTNVTLLTAASVPPPAATSHAFVAAMAGLGGASGTEAALTHAPLTSVVQSLVSPGAHS